MCQTQSYKHFTASKQPCAPGVIATGAQCRRSQVSAAQRSYVSCPRSHSAQVAAQEERLHAVSHRAGENITFWTLPIPQCGHSCAEGWGWGQPSLMCIPRGRRAALGPELRAGGTAESARRGRLRQARGPPRPRTDPEALLPTPPPLRGARGAVRGATAGGGDSWGGGRGRPRDHRARSCPRRAVLARGLRRRPSVSLPAKRAVGRSRPAPPELPSPPSIIHFISF